MNSAEPRPGLDLAVPAEHATVLSEQPVVESVAHDLAQEQRVAAGQVPQRGDAAAVERRAERGGEQGLDLLARQLAEVEERAQVVLPERPQGVRRRIAPAQRHDRERLARGDELMDERGRCVVEQLAVVDAQHQPPPGGPLGQRVAGPREQLHAVGQRRRRQDRANAPSGIERAEPDARTHSTAQSRAAASAAASVASRVLPTPAGPAITTPPESPSASVSPTSSSSASRPVNGHRIGASLIDRRRFE